MSVITNRLDFMSEVLQDFCTLHNLEFLSADDLLHDPSNELTEYQKDWLTGYVQTWDILQEVEYEDQKWDETIEDAQVNNVPYSPLNENSEYGKDIRSADDVNSCITNGTDYSECVDRLVETMEESK